MINETELGTFESCYAKKFVATATITSKVLALWLSEGELHCVMAWSELTGK